MVAPRRNGGPGACSWDYSNADSFTDSMYSNMTFYNTSQSSALHPHYATLPRNTRNESLKKTTRISEVPPPYAVMEMLLEDYHREQDADSGYASGSGRASPEVADNRHCPPTRQSSVLRHPAVSASPRKTDYYYLRRPSPSNPKQYTFEHGLGFDPTTPSISFVCGMQSLASGTTKGQKKKRRRNNDVSKSDTDPMTYIRENCENATRALSSHRKLHNCDCDFAYLDNRQRGTGTVWRKEEAGEGIPIPRAGFGPQKPCKKRWYTGWFVRQHMKFHDQYCGCGCFGFKR